MKALKLFAYIMLSLHFVACGGRPLQIVKGDQRSRGSHGVPDAVQGLNAHAISSSEIELTWLEAPGSAAYRVEVSIGDSNYWSVGILSNDDTNVTMSSLRPNTGYNFRVRGFNSIGDGGNSNVAFATTLQGGGGGAGGGSGGTGGGNPPAEPTWVGQGLVLQGTDTAVATWNPVDGANGYSVWARVRNVTTYYIAATVPANVTQFTYLGLPPDITLDIQIEAYNDFGLSPLSAQRSVTTPSAPTGTGGGGGGPPPPAFVRFEMGKYGRLNDTTAPLGVLASICDAALKVLFPKAQFGLALVLLSLIRGEYLGTGTATLPATDVSASAIKNLINSINGTNLSSGTMSFILKPAGGGQPATVDHLIRELFFKRYLNRLPTAAELNQYRSHILGLGNFNSAKALLLGSAEFYTHAGGTKAAWATLTLQKLLKYNPAQTQIDNLVASCGACGELQRRARARAIIDEPVFKVHFFNEIDDYFQFVLERPPTGAEKSGLNKGANRDMHERVLRDILITAAKAEYQAQFNAFINQPNGGACGPF